MTRRRAALPPVAIASMLLVLWLGPAQGQSGPAYAIRDATIVPVSGPTLARATVVMRNGLIEAVGTGIKPPSDAYVIDGRRLVVYPGLIDMGTTAGIEPPSVPYPSSPRFRDEIERWKRQVILRPQLTAASLLQQDRAELTRLLPAGVTTVLAVPPGEVITGQSALVNVVTREASRDVGTVADARPGRPIVASPVALHVEFPERPSGDGYPSSLMGVIAFVRQSFLDAQHYQLAWTRYLESPRGLARPEHDEALAALQPAVARRVPVAFEARRARGIHRALRLAEELDLDPIVTGGHQADHALDVLERTGARVLFSLEFPERPEYLSPDEDEPMRVLRERRGVPAVPAALAAAGIPFGFQSSGIDPALFLRRIRQTVAAGLPKEAALRALTQHAAEIAGAGHRLGSVDAGKIANLLVTDGDLFDDDTRVVQLFVDGVPVDPSRPRTPPENPRRRRGGW